MIFRALLLLDDFEVHWGVSPWSWLLGADVEWHPTEATASVHLGPVALIVGWRR